LPAWLGMRDNFPYENENKNARRQIMKSTCLRLVLPAVLLAAVLPAASHAEGEGDKTTVEAKIRYCKDCHGQQGQGFLGAYPVPRLAGQTFAYLKAKAEVILEHKRDNQAANNFAAPALASMNPALRGDVYDHFSKLNPPPAAPGPQELTAAGRKIYEEGVAAEDIPACASCHGPDGKGNGEVPRVAGQIYPYAVKTLSNWSIINRERAREDSKAVKDSAHRLSHSQVEAVSAYISNLN
jgi:cytochrome c553